jgi:hypothetical protein
MPSRRARHNGVCRNRISAQEEPTNEDQTTATRTPPDLSTSADRHCDWLVAGRLANRVFPSLDPATASSFFFDAYPAGTGQTVEISVGRTFARTCRKSPFASVVSPNGTGEQSGKCLMSTTRKGLAGGPAKQRLLTCSSLPLESVTVHRATVILSAAKDLAPKHSPGDPSLRSG